MGTAGCRLAVLAAPRGFVAGRPDELQRMYGLVAATIAPHAQVCVNAAEALHPAIRQILQEAGVEEEHFLPFQHPAQ